MGFLLVLAVTALGAIAWLLFRIDAKLPHHHGSRSSGLPSNPPEKKSDEAPAGHYQLREFPAEIRLWTSVANGHRRSNVCSWG